MIQLRHVRVILLLVVICSVSGCGSDSVVGGSDLANLTGKVWVLQSYNIEGNLESVIAGTRITITFNSANSLEGSAGCNEYSGGYSIIGTQMSISVRSVGVEECDSPAGIMEQEASYLVVLQQTQRYEATASELRLWYTAVNQMNFIAE